MYIRGYFVVITWWKFCCHVSNIFDATLATASNHPINNSLNQKTNQRLMKLDANDVQNMQTAGGHPAERPSNYRYIDYVIISNVYFRSNKN